MMSLEEVRPLQLSPDKAECRYGAAHHLMAVGLLSYRAVLEVDLDTCGSSVHVSESEDLSKHGGVFGGLSPSLGLLL